MMAAAPAALLLIILETFHFIRKRQGSKNYGTGLAMWTTSAPYLYTYYNSVHVVSVLLSYAGLRFCEGFFVQS